MLDKPVEPVKMLDKPVEPVNNTVQIDTADEDLERDQQ